VIRVGWPCQVRGCGEPGRRSGAWELGELAVIVHLCDEHLDTVTEWLRDATVSVEVTDRRPA
jgi:hypothetical protein